jgi:ABC-type uncharacterized transport system auxiliary subunit
MKAIKIILTILLSGMIAACSLPGGEVPADHFYRLPPLAPDAAQGLTKKIQINQVRASGIYHERAMLYVEAGEPQEIKRYSYHYWTDAPASLLHNYFSSRFDSVSSAASGPVLQLNMQVLNFERVLGQGSADAFVRIRVDVNHASKSEIKFSKIYEARAAATSLALPDTARAFGEALEVIAQAIERDMAGV